MVKIELASYEATNYWGEEEGWGGNTKIHASLFAEVIRCKFLREHLSSFPIKPEIEMEDLKDLNDFVAARSARDFVVVLVEAALSLPDARTTMQSSMSSLPESSF